MKNHHFDEPHQSHLVKLSITLLLLAFSLIATLLLFYGNYNIQHAQAAQYGAIASLASCTIYLFKTIRTPVITGVDIHQDSIKLHCTPLFIDRKSTLNIESRNLRCFKPAANPKKRRLVTSKGEFQFYSANGLRKFQQAMNDTFFANQELVL